MLKIGLLLVGLAGILPSLACAQTAPAGTCASLENQWRDVEVELAALYADGVTDNSAPRATMRAAESSAQLTKANGIMTLMSAHKCVLPKRAPSEMTYAASALNCATERVKGNYKSDLCDRSKWTAEIPKR